MKITRFEDIKAWQEARKLVKSVYNVINEGEKFQKDFRLVNQIQGAAVSSMANISEGLPEKAIGNLLNTCSFQKARQQKSRVTSMWRSIKDI